MNQTEPTGHGDKPEPSGRFRLLSLIAVFALLGYFTYRHFGPGIFSPSDRRLRGEFLNAVAVPGPQGEPQVWILTDGSRHYIMRRESPGRFSVARKCLSCKTWTYVYDPVNRNVLARIQTDYRTLILGTGMVHVNGRIWVVSGPYEENEPRIDVYDVQRRERVRQTSDVIAAHLELRSGLINVRLERNPDRLLLDTRDGRTGLVLTLNDERLYPSESEFRRITRPPDQVRGTAFVLGREGSNLRRKLFRVTGPRAEIGNSSLEFFVADPRQLFSAAKAIAEPATPERVYIEGEIFYQDSDGCFVLHQDAAGRKANRLFTRVDADGKEKWTAPPETLFPEMRIDLDKNATSAIFFMKKNIDVSRLGGLVLLQLRGVGAIGFDFEIGRRLWDVSL